MAGTTPTLRQRLGGRSLYLVGMMGCGKSSTGRPLAERLGYGFVDVDAVIEQVAGSSISEIFAREGEDSFRDLETQVLRSISERHSLVVATGGGIVTRSENWGMMHQGIVIWLDVERDQLLLRLQSDSTRRPLLQVNDPGEAVDAILGQRRAARVLGSDQDSRDAQQALLLVWMREPWRAPFESSMLRGPDGCVVSGLPGDR